MQELLDRLARTIERYDLIRPLQKVLVAISGGPDSVFLAGALHHMGYDIGLAHVNYHLRGQDSENEEQLVKAYAQQWEIPVYICQADPKGYAQTHKLSLQVACRDIRYDWFNQVIRAEGYDRCATAHHLNDQAESILMSLVKGNSESAIHGIPLQRGPFVRPLVEITKTEILEALKENNWAYSLDYTNEKNDYLRNRFRNQIIPLLKEINPDLESQLNHRLAWYQQQQAFIRKTLDLDRNNMISVTHDGISLDWMPFVNKYGAEHLPVLLAEIVAEWGLHGHEIAQCILLIDSQPGKWTETATATLTRTRSGLLFQLKTTLDDAHQPLILEKFPQSETLVFGSTQLIFSIEKKISLPQAFVPELVVFDIEKIHFPLTIRHWKQGDRMKPLGMKGHKKLSDIFVDEKYDPVEKQKALVFEDQKGIVFLSGYRIADRVKITAQTQTAGKVVIHN